jgi:Cell division initiation protein
MAPARAFFGYNAGATDRLLEEIASSFEDVWRERADLADKIEQLDADLVRYRELEALLRTTLVSAERASAEMKEQARREAELILTEAHAEARAVQRQALAENERLVRESRQIRERLRAALTETGEADAPSAAERRGREPRPRSSPDTLGRWSPRPPLGCGCGSPQAHRARESSAGTATRGRSASPQRPRTAARTTRSSGCSQLRSASRAAT